MKPLILFLGLLVPLAVGCRSVGNSLTVVGSAYVESERPEGKAVAKVEVRYSPTPPVQVGGNGTVAPDEPECVGTGRRSTCGHASASPAHGHPAS